MQQVGLTSTFITQNGHDLGVRLGIMAIEIDDSQQLLSLTGIKLSNVIAGTDIVIGMAGEVVAEGVARLPQNLHRIRRYGSIKYCSHFDTLFCFVGVSTDVAGLCMTLRTC